MDIVIPSNKITPEILGAMGSSTLATPEMLQETLNLVAYKVKDETDPTLVARYLESLTLLAKNRKISTELVLNLYSFISSIDWVEKLKVNTSKWHDLDIRAQLIVVALIKHPSMPLDMLTEIGKRHGIGEIGQRVRGAIIDVPNVKVRHIATFPIVNRTLAVLNNELTVDQQALVATIAPQFKGTIGDLYEVVVSTSPTI